MPSLQLRRLLWHHRLPLPVNDNISNETDFSNMTTDDKATTRTLNFYDKTATETVLYGMSTQQTQSL